MSNIADKIKGTQDKDGMLRRALERIIQLYTDKSHFVYELLQNAEDAKASSIRFIQYADRLEVLHDGKPFTSENLQGLCDIGKSDKVDNLNQIGEFGVGFKSVFGICDTVKLYSDPQNYSGKMEQEVIPFAVEIIDFTRPEDIQWEKLESNYTTKFIFPYSVGKTFSGFETIEKLNKTLSSKLQNLGITTLLFMNNLQLIEYQIRLDGISTEGEYLLEKTVINDHCLFVSALGTVDSMKKETEDVVESYLKFSRPIPGMNQRSVDIAFPVIRDSEDNYECVKSRNPFVSVYFPTETESKLNFIVQGPYRTTPNRSSIPADDMDNKRFVQETASLLKDSILELREHRKFNMSFFKVLPISARAFDNFDLFYPLYETTRNLFLSEPMVPCKSGGYVLAQYAKIARQERLTNVFNDNFLTQLINDQHQYKWLPTMLTETNREYEQVYRFLTSELKVDVIRPEDLRVFFANNPNFLPTMTDGWIAELYNVLENVGAAFSKSRNESNMLTAEIVKTTTGKFVAPYRKTENRQYIPNVFLPSEIIKSKEINTVDPALYQRCRHFFDDILQLQKPNEYEFIVKDIRKRYSNSDYIDGDRHIEDLKHLIKYIRFDEYKDEVTQLIKDVFLVRCNDGEMRNCNMFHIYLPMTADGINIEAYYRNIIKKIYFVDADFYALHDIDISVLVMVGVRDSIVIGETITNGTYDNGLKTRQPSWWTLGEFRWKFSLDSVKDVLKYISLHPMEKDSILKSQAIFKTLMLNEEKLCGDVSIGGSTPNLENETCELIKILRGERTRDWNGKWLYTESMETVSQKTVSKHDISMSIYGRIKPDSSVYELLGFRKTDADKVDDLKKAISKEQLDAFFEAELKQRFGITSADLSDVYGGENSRNRDEDEEEIYLFPIGRVKNWETLRKHAAEMLCYADPVKYDYAVRRLRVSNHPKETKAYLLNMYRYDGVYKYACQMCHDSCSTVETAQLFNNPEVELDPMNLCLCPNCAAKYRTIRSNDYEMKSLRRRIFEVKESDVSNGEQVKLPVGGHELWFTQTHFAEIQELIKLTDEVKKDEGHLAPTKSDDHIQDDGDKAGLSVYSGYVGKCIKRKNDDFEGIITKVNDNYAFVDITAGNKAGTSTQIQLSYVLKKNGIYEIY